MRREFPPQCVAAEISAAGSSRYDIHPTGSILYIYALIKTHPASPAVSWSDRLYVRQASSPPTTLCWVSLSDALARLTKFDLSVWWVLWGHFGFYGVTGMARHAGMAATSQAWRLWNLAAWNGSLWRLNAPMAGESSPSPTGQLEEDLLEIRDPKVWTSIPLNFTCSSCFLDSTRLMFYATLCWARFGGHFLSIGHAYLLSGIELANDEDLCRWTPSSQPGESWYLGQNGFSNPA